MLSTPEQIARALGGVRTVAVLGLHPQRGRPAWYVPEDLNEAGWRILPVNPGFVGATAFGEPFRARLDEIDEPIDLVDVFRRSEWIAGHVPEILAMKHRPRIVWLQSGIRDDASARRLSDAGIDVVQDRCLMVERQRLGLGAP